nr:MAG TPA: hypothetical protein [Caudoviricetes sp.]
MFFESLGARYFSYCCFLINILIQNNTTRNIQCFFFIDKI